jgi:signal transduction histidine kinase
LIANQIGRSQESVALDMSRSQESVALDTSGRRRIFGSNLDAIHRRTDQMFFWLLLAQWIFAIGLAIQEPYGWEGSTRHIHAHVKFAIGFGAVINLVPLLLIRRHPGWHVTRHVVAITQMLWSAMLIMLTNGRIETHFHIFGSLAFLAFYRDWRVLVTATLMVAGDHLARGTLWPDSVYGILNPEWWRFLEHAGWVVFEDVVLVFGCRRALAEMWIVADREAALATLNRDIENRVEERTQQLLVANQSLAHEMESRLQAEAELRQAQKLESVGRLAAGVAHEINTPVQFVNDSIHFLRDATADLLSVVDRLETVQRAVVSGDPPRIAAERAAEECDRIDLEFLRERIPKAFDRSIDGLQRVATIVRSMKEFAHPDAAELSAVDLNAAIESTLVIARNEYKYVADVVTELGELPLVTCLPGAINQVFLNIVVNAAHAIGEVVDGTEQRGTIVVRTRAEGDRAVIEISDTGAGIPDHVKSRIFDPFFTTKEVGKGTGQGLAIVRSVIDQHEGTIAVVSTAGHTTFTLQIPIDGPCLRKEAA